MYVREMLTGCWTSFVKDEVEVHILNLNYDMVSTSLLSLNSERLKVNVKNVTSIFLCIFFSVQIETDMLKTDITQANHPKLINQVFELTGQYV